MTHRPLTIPRLAAWLTWGLMAAGLGPAHAAERVPVVVELFTSQGCASCQPASQMLGEFAREPGILALTFPVTYWDYLGWKDVFGKAAFTDRQRAYASLRGERQIFTPQVVVNGEPSMVRSDHTSVERGVRRARASGLVPVPVRSAEQGELLSIDIGAGTGPDLQAEIWLLPVLRRRKVAIGGGENKGRIIEYVNVVRGMHRVGAWTGLPAHFEVPSRLAHEAEADTYVILLQGGTGAQPARILGATHGPGF